MSDENRSEYDDAKVYDVVPRSSRALDAELHLGHGQFWTSVDPATKDGRRLLKKIKIGPVIRLSTCVDRVIDIVHIYRHVASSRPDRNGEVPTFVRTCLIGADEQIYVTAGAYIAQDLAELVQAHGMPPWNPPLHLAPLCIPISGGNPVVRIVEAE